MATSFSACYARHQAEASVSQERWLSTYMPQVHIHSQVDWSFVQEHRASANKQRFFIETWFLSPQSPLCVRSRRFFITPSSTIGDFQKQCLWLWADFIDVEHSVTLTPVHPKPDTLMSTMMQILVHQNIGATQAGFLLKGEELPIFAKHRAVLTHTTSASQQVLRDAQVDLSQIIRDFPCLMQEVGGVHRSFSTYEFPTVTTGSVWYGKVLPFDLPQAPESDSSDDEDVSTTASLEADASHESEASDWTSLAQLGLTLGQPSESNQEMNWAETPLPYLLEDVFHSEIAPLKFGWQCIPRRRR